MSTSGIGAVLDEVGAALVRRLGLYGVSVFTGPVPFGDEVGLECIAFGDAKLKVGDDTMGGNREEVWEVEGETYAFRSWEGGTELAIKAARDRALALLGELDSHLNDTYTGEYPNAELSAAEMLQNYTVEGRSCRFRFTMTVTAKTNP